jgi:hypothetical protein
MNAIGFSAWTSTAEAPAALASVVQSCVTAGIERQALILRLGRLPSACIRPHHLRLFRAALDPLLDADRASAFRLPDETVVVVWRGAAEKLLARALAAVRHLLADMPAQLPPWEQLAEVTTLPASAEPMLRLIAESEPAAGGAVGTGTSGPRLAPLDAKLLESLERSLTQTDLSSFVRRRPVCHLDEQGVMHLQWEERGLALADLAAMLVPGRSLTADPWLFLRLARTLDRRLLTLLSEPAELRQAPPFALDLTLEGLLGAEFLRFDAALPASLRGGVVINLRAADLLADGAAFTFARDFAHARQYRLALHGATPRLLAAFSVRPGAIDLAQIRFTPGRAAFELPSGVDPACIVLADTDTPAALERGRAAGIRLFKGALARPNDPAATFTL